ncbi:hypothetical protein TNCV_3360021 [Trichonephila clavipes]|nr:hypothetical protein TNCV_3360021 [Trichonephila clavipes]
MMNFMGLDLAFADQVVAAVGEWSWSQICSDVIESWVRNLVSLKTHRVESLMRIKSVNVQKPPMAGYGNFEKGRADQASTSSFVSSSKLHGPSKIASILRYNATLINNQIVIIRENSTGLG